MNQEPIVLEQSFTAPASVLWQALTDNDEMKQWYFELKKFDAIPGFEFQFYGDKDEKKYLHLCKIVEVVEGEKIAYSWRYADYPGESLVSFELFAEGGNTRLILTHKGIESFPANNPDFAKESFAAGWNYIIGTSLKGFIEKTNGK